MVRMSIKSSIASYLLTTDEAAKKLHCTPQAIARACATGRLPATKKGREWLIDRRDLARFKPGKAGRPRKRSLRRVASSKP